jgi:acetyl-CoA/propionyl-CoA carboxylase biotin carboxyl carrier protein
VADAAAVPAPVSGTLQGWKVADGDEVAQGTVIAVMEAMKMEMQVVAHRAGRITMSTAAGGYVAAGVAIATIG